MKYRIWFSDNKNPSESWVISPEIGPAIHIVRRVNICVPCMLPQANSSATPKAWIEVMGHLYISDDTATITKESHQ